MSIPDALSFAECCKNAASVSELRRIVFGRDPLALAAKDIAVVSRAAQRLDVETNIRFAFTGTHTIQPLPDYLKAHGLAIGYGISDFIAPYGQYIQQLLDNQSDLIDFDPNLLFVSCALRQLAPRLHNEFAALSPAEIGEERQRLLEHVCQVSELATARTSATVLIANFPRPPYPSLGIADAKREMGETEFYISLNLELLRRFKDSDRVHIVDMDRLVGGLRRESNDRMYFVAKSAWPESACNAIAQELLRYVVGSTGQTKKCLVVDLDNTLWDGVVGEDGAAGVNVGPGSPVGEAFQDFQYVIRSLRERGVVLAICSKNNPGDAEETFSARPDMPLKLRDFAVAEISWHDKPFGVRHIAETLNLGTDSLVFVDDNPAERTVVRGATPEVVVLELPRDPSTFARFLRRQVCFEKLRISSDDVTRLHDYGAKVRREKLLGASGTLAQYLAELQTQITIKVAGRSDLARVHELFNKTNQFNLTTHRYTVADVERFLKQPQFVLGVIAARDAYGAMGTIGVYLLEVDGDLARLDSFLLSCRALGRGIGTAGMNFIKRQTVQELNCSRIVAEFIPTHKNVPASGFLGRQGFNLMKRNEDGSEVYEAAGVGLDVLSCEHVTIVSKFSSAK